MSEKQVLVGDLLKIDGFDPMNVNVSYIQQTTNLIPADGSIDLNEAEKLATVFLKCADYCGDLMAQAVRYFGYTDAEKKSEKASSIERKVEAKMPATTAKETFSNDPKFVTASNKNTDAQAFLTWVTQKQENLIRAHVLCKDLLKAHVQNRNASGWEGAEESFETPKPVLGISTPDKRGNLASGLDSIEDDFQLDV